MISSAYEAVGAFLFLVGLGVVFYASQIGSSSKTRQGQEMDLRAVWESLRGPEKVGFVLMFAAILFQCAAAIAN